MVCWSIFWTGEVRLGGPAVATSVPGSRWQCCRSGLSRWRVVRRSEHGSWHRWASQEMRAALLILSANWMTCRDIILFALTNVSSATTCPLRTSVVLRGRLPMVADVLVAHANFLAGVFLFNVSATIHASVWDTNDDIRAYESCLRHGFAVAAHHSGALLKLLA